MAELRDSQFVPPSPEYEAPDTASSFVLSPEQQEIDELACHLLEQDVLAEGGYLDQLYPPASRKIFDKRDESPDDREKRQWEYDQWWKSEPAAVVEREKSRFRKIYRAGLEMGEDNNDPLIILSDVDQTFVERNDFTNEAVLSPAFFRAIEGLSREFPGRVHLGLLTTVNSEWAADHYLERVDPAVLDRNFVLDVRTYCEKTGSDLNLASARWTPETVSKYESLKEIIHPALFEAVARGELSPRLLYSETKLEVLNDQHLRHPEARFLFIENMPYANLVRRDNDHVRAVPVGPEIQDPEERESYLLQRDLLYKPIAGAGLLLDVLL